MFINIKLKQDDLNLAVQALRLAADQYDGFAQQCATDARLSAQFRRQATQARAVALAIEEQDE